MSHEYRASPVLLYDQQPKFDIFEINNNKINKIIHFEIA